MFSFYFISVCLFRTVAHNGDQLGTEVDSVSARADIRNFSSTEWSSSHNSVFTSESQHRELSLFSYSCRQCDDTHVSAQAHARVLARARPRTQIHANICPDAESMRARANTHPSAHICTHHTPLHTRRLTKQPTNLPANLPNQPANPPTHLPTTSGVTPATFRSAQVRSYDDRA